VDWLCEVLDDLLDWASEHPYVCAALFILFFFGGFAVSIHIGIGIK